MRLRITREMCGNIDGVQLDHFKVGELYDVGISLAHYLMGCGFALPVVDERPARLVLLGPQDGAESVTDRSSADQAESRCVRGNFSGTSRSSSSEPLKKATARDVSSDQRRS